ncbi:MAG: DUF1109 domain-containing protein [Myxococcaceae bacterium]|nr:DUF1109 domain-containing protein [Myxococcaceae bacterium]
MTPDQLVSPSTRELLDRVRAAARHEIRTGKPIARWHTQLVTLLGATLGVVLIAAAGLLLTGQATPAGVLAHLPQLGSLLGAAVVCAVAALWPRVRGAGFMAVTALLAAACIVALRAEPAIASESAGWTCLVSHLGAGSIPVAVALWLLRSFAPSTGRALVAGAAAGTTGAMLGEMGCQQGAMHIAIWHLGAWVIIATVVVLVASRLKRRSYAP